MKCINSFLQENSSDTKEVVKCLIFDEQDKILLLRRSDVGEWDIPGGHVEKDESKEDAIEREVFEETNIRLLHLKKLKSIKVKIPAIFRTDNVALYKAKPDPNSDIDISKLSKHDHKPEHTEFKWIKYSHELNSMPMLDDIRNELKQHLKKGN